MIRAALLAASLLAAAPALAEQADGGSAPVAGGDLEALRRDLLEQARKEADARVSQAKEELHNEVRAELATQSANHSWEEEWQEQKKKLELLELDGYLRTRPTLFHDMDLSRGLDADGKTLYPRPSINDADLTKGRSQAWVDMRFRLEPTINISEDIRIRSQLDFFDNLVLGSSPELDARSPTAFFSMSQVTPANAIRVKRAWAEVNTPVGLLSFGRMGSNWGTGMLHNDGNCLDCDYGDTVDRISFAARVAGYYVVPMFDYVGKGPTTAKDQPEQGVFGQPIDRDQASNVAGPLAGPVFSLALAKRDTDKEIQRKLDAGESSLNYGVFFSYRRQRYTPNGGADGQTPVATGASMYVPDLWARFMSSRLKLEAEVAGIFGSLDDVNLVPTGVPQSVSMTQLGAVLTADVKALEGGHLHLLGEVGFASGDSAPGLGNVDVLGGKPTQLGSVDGPQFNCATGQTCKDASIDNFRFNRDYRVDMILWREILGGVTDALYVKPGVKYEIAEGFGVKLNAIYSRTIFSASSPSGSNPNLGIELDPGVEYRSDDGFAASVDYGLLVPLPGLKNPPNAFHSAAIDPSLAHAVRAMIAVKF